MSTRRIPAAPRVGGHTVKLSGTRPARPQPLVCAVGTATQSRNQAGLQWGELTGGGCSSVGHLELSITYNCKRNRKTPLDPRNMIPEILQKLAAESSSLPSDDGYACDPPRSGDRCRCRPPRPTHRWRETPIIPLPPSHARSRAVPHPSLHPIRFAFTEAGVPSATAQ